MKKTYSANNAKRADVSETENHPPMLITENGIAKAHIAVSSGTTPLEQYAVRELTAHIELVSGGAVPVVNTAEAGSLPIVIGTPDSVPELETLFPDDLNWLRDTGNNTEVRWGSDGFAIRSFNDKLYIFGATPRGVLNGVYDFIEINMGVLWTRAEETVGTVYDPLPTIIVKKTDYREKSPFPLRGWTLAGNVSQENHVMLTRNKLNGAMASPWENTETLVAMASVGINPFLSNHNIKWWIKNSPSYDPDNHEYWSTTPEGEHVAPEDSKQVDFWSDVTVRCVADSVLAFLDKNKTAAGIGYIGICLEDFEPPHVYPEMTLPFEYAPGQFADPAEENFIPTVYFTFLNKIAKIVTEKYPDIRFHTYAFAQTTAAPACALHDNVYATFCPINEDLCAPLGESPMEHANIHYQYLLDWAKHTSGVQVYNYYGCYLASSFYERPIWERIRSDLQLYQAKGFNGLMPEGVYDTDTPLFTAPMFGINNEAREPYLNMRNIWAMNAMTFWIYGKLSWNPEADIDSLITYYCDKVYGHASEHMKEYYRLLRMGWQYGCATLAAQPDGGCVWDSKPEMYFTYFLDVKANGVHILEAIREALHKAYEAANDTQKERLRYIIEVYDNGERLFNPQ